MQRFRNWRDLPASARGASVALGNFDGVHLGHAHVLRAAAELGRPWSVRGEVTHGDQRGRTIGFPTANVPLGRHLEPARGVYAVNVRLADGRVVPGVANIGRRPTVNEGPESRLEAHLFDFEGDLYGQEVAVALHRFLRAERRFAGLDDLRAQIAVDAAEARAMLDAVADRPA